VLPAGMEAQTAGGNKQGGVGNVSFLPLDLLFAADLVAITDYHFYLSRKKDSRLIWLSYL